MRQIVSTFTGVFVKAEEGGYSAYAEELPGANTQGETLEEARANLKEAIQLVLETNRKLTAASSESGDVIREAITVEIQSR